MAKTRRVVFSFDDRSLVSLDKLNEQERHRRSELPDPNTRYTEVAVRNPETGETRTIVIPEQSNA